MSRRQSFAIIKSLIPRLEKVGVSDKALWAYMLSSFEVSSRKDLTEREWTLLAARLSAAEKDSTLFGVLVDEIKKCVGLCRVVRVHSDGTFKEVYEGVITPDIEARCQSHADKSGWDGIKCFDLNCPPVASPNPKKPARVFEIHRSANETRYVEVDFPDCSDIAGWGQRHVNECGMMCISRVDLDRTFSTGLNRFQKYAKVSMK